jgi:phage gpG-like protein
MENPEQFFLRLQYEFENLTQLQALQIVQDEAEMFVRQNFLNQGFKDVSFEAWKPRKSNKDEGRAILVKNSFLRRAATVSEIQGNAVVFTLPLPYAARHNFGRNGMPQRQFIGDSAYLRARIKQRIQEYLNNRNL